MARLEMRREDRTKEYELGDNTILGRKSDCTICVPSPRASRAHCRIVKSGGKFYLEDLGAANGTILNGNKITERSPLKNHDKISIGGIDFQFLEENNDPLVGTTLGKYKIVEKVGVGGMGVVYRALQTTLGRTVALKVMNKKLASQESFIQSFEREAKIAAKLQHQNIIGIHDFGYENGWYYFSMEFVKGENLLDLTQRQGSLSTDECLPYAVQVAEALVHAHSHGVLHKDIKPQNIMITPDNIVKLADMGLASLMRKEDEEEDNSDKPIMATPQYVPPEIIRRRDADQRSDIYSFAATLYHVVTGKVPYEAGDIKELLKMHLNAPVPDPHAVNPRVSADLAAFIMKGLSKSPDERQQSAEECLKELQAISRKNTLELEKEAPAPAKRPRSKTGSHVALKDTGDITSENTMKVQNYDEDGAAPAPSALTKFITTIRDLGPAKIAGGLAGAVVLALALYFVCHVDMEEEAQMLWQQKVANKVEKDDLTPKEEAELRLALEKLVTDYAETTYKTKAQAKLKILELSLPLRNLERVKARVNRKKTSKAEAVKELRDYLQTHEGLQAEEKEKISAFIVSIGGDPDIRPEWEKQYSKLKDNGDLPAARAVVQAAWEQAEGTEKSRIYSIRENLTNEMERAFQTEAIKAKDLLNNGKFVEAMGAFRDTRRIFRDTPDESGSKALNIIGTQVVRPLGGTIAKAWLEFREHIKVADFAAVKATADTLQTNLAEHLRKDVGGQFIQMAQAVEKFYAAVLRDAQKNTKDQVRVTVDGKEHKASIEGRDGQLFAIGKNNQKAINLTDINIEDIRKVVKAADLQAHEALGGMLFLLTNGNPNDAAMFRRMTEGQQAVAPILKLLDNLLAGNVQVYSLADVNPEKGLNRSGKDSLGYRITFADKGVHELPALALPLQNMLLQVKADKNVTLDLAASSDRMLSIAFKDGKVEISGKNGEQSIAPTGVNLPPTAALNLRFRESELEVTDGKQTLTTIPLNEMETWYAAAIFRTANDNQTISDFTAYMCYPALAATEGKR